MPFFTYYGGKFRVAPKYPPPLYAKIIEPFAGAAGYSLLYPLRQVHLVDLNPNITRTWDYLIHVSEDEIRALPDIGPGQTVDDLGVCEEARLFIGWWLNKGTDHPCRVPSTFMLKYPQGGPYWGQRVRDRVVKQLSAIRHWTVELGDYRNLVNQDATWFIDPPYLVTGRRYRFGSGGIDFTELAQWCRSRHGQVIACDADGADWLPFTALAVIDGTEGRQKTKRARTEVVWTSV